MTFNWNTSMTTKWLLILPIVFVGWIGVMAGVMLFSDAAPAAVVLFPSADFIAQLPPDAGILSRNAISITLSSGMEGFGSALYQSGAWLVLPAGLTGCLPLPKP